MNKGNRGQGCLLLGSATYTNGGTWERLGEEAGCGSWGNSWSGSGWRHWPCRYCFRCCHWWTSSSWRGRRGAGGSKTLVPPNFLGLPNSPRGERTRKLPGVLRRTTLLGHRPKVPKKYRSSPGAKRERAGVSRPFHASLRLATLPRSQRWEIGPERRYFDDGRLCVVLGPEPRYGLWAQIAMALTLQLASVGVSS